MLLRFGELVKDFHIHVIFATDKAIAGKPEALRGFSRAGFETIAFMRTHRNETVEIAKDVMGTDAQTTGGIYDELMPMFSDTGRFDPKALAVLRKSFVEMKTLPEEPDMGKLCTEAFSQALGDRTDDNPLGQSRPLANKMDARAKPAHAIPGEIRAAGTVAIPDRVSHHFGEESDARHVRALRDTSLDITRGELLCLIGPSGCGKSTCSTSSAD